MTARWRKSSFSTAAEGNCVEVAFADKVGVRDSKNTTRTLAFSPVDWRTFIAQQAPRR